MMFVALAMFVRIFGKQGFVVAAFNQADQFCRTFRTFYLVAESTALFYRKIRMVISHHLALAADEVLKALSSWTKAVSADGGKAAVVAVRQERWLSSAF